MNKKIGLWIDHKKAVLIIISDSEKKIKEIQSNVSRQRNRFGGVHSNLPYQSHQVPADDLQENEFKRHLNIYYNNVITNLKNAESIFIFGPGEAKRELMNHIVKNKLFDKVTGLETTDRMTNRQIQAKVLKRFVKSKFIDGMPRCMQLHYAKTIK